MDELHGAQLQWIMYDVVLPPKLPSRGQGQAHERVLIDSVYSSLIEFASLVSERMRAPVKQTARMIRSFRETRDGRGGINRDSLLRLLPKLRQKQSSAILHVQAQNAAIILHGTGDGVVFQAFELHPPNKDVVTTVGRLQRCFPDLIVRVEADTFDSSDFQSTVADALVKMSTQNPLESNETLPNDSASPALVTDLLFSFLLANGNSRPGPKIWKCTREEVTISDAKNANIPWRRSPVWLALRVAMHLNLSTIKTDFVSDGIYKRFMVFFLSQLLKRATEENMHADLLHAAKAKLSRRLLKLGKEITQNEEWLDPVKESLNTAESQLEERWNEIKEACTDLVGFARLEAFNVEQDLMLNLPELDEFLKSALNRMPNDRRIPFEPKSGSLSFALGELPVLDEIESGDGCQIQNLYAFEDWVSTHFTTWISLNISAVTTCDKLYNIIRTYHELAQRHYQGSAEGMSQMILTILELWVGCDKSAVENHPLLAEFPPDIPLELFEFLLLRFKTDMGRLFRAERYLKDRSSNATRRRERSAIFSFGKEGSFSAEFAAKSTEHLSLLNKIDDEAEQVRQSRCAEFEQQFAQYNALVEQYTGMNCQCDYHEDQEFLPQEMCERCCLRAKASKLEISVYEWPLPSDNHASLSVIFEMAVPLPFKSWRDTTLMFLVDVLKLKLVGSDEAQSRCSLGSYPGLSGFCDSVTPEQRVILCSQKKPRSALESRLRIGPETTEQDVCVPSSAEWKLLDSLSKPSAKYIGACWRSSPHVPEICTVEFLPKTISIEEVLGYGPGRNGRILPNTVLARQAACPQDAPLQEHLALYSLAWGPQTQWMNILRQLAMPEQAGPATLCAARDTHEVLKSEPFVKVFLQNLETALSFHSGSWASCKAVWIFTLLAARTFSLGPDETRVACLAHMAKCRKICLQWLETLQLQILEANEHEARSKLLAKSLEVALVCLSTFDVEPDHLAEIFEQTDHAIMYLRCIILKEQARAQNDNDAVNKVLLFRSKRLAQRSLNYWSETIRENRSLDTVARLTWKGYPSVDQAWEFKAMAWAVTTVTQEQSGQNVSVSLNFLTGEFLIDGRPLSQLPTEYVTHPEYKTFFSCLTVQILPSTEPGFQFSTQRAFGDHDISLGLGELCPSSGSRDLFLRARKGSTQIFDLIPPRVLTANLPSRFVDDFVYFLDSVTGSIDARTRQDPWTPGSAGWRLESYGAFWRFCKTDGSVLVNPRSDTAVAVFGVFRSLENPCGIHVLYYAEKAQVHTHIPRLKLDFTVDIGSDIFKSRQHRGFCVSSDQEFGTLIGLRHKILLCNEGESSPRILLIPHGTVSCHESSISNYVTHVTVEVGTSSEGVIAFKIDNCQRTLKGSSLSSNLTLAYLHALTSFCVPDPWTRLTGTEQALRILQGKDVGSFTTLDVESLEILSRIANLSPKRRYMDPDNPAVEVVTWGNKCLSSSSQSSSLYTAVKPLLDKAFKTRFLYPDSYFKLPQLAFGDANLLKRSAIRTSSFQNSGFGAEEHTTKEDAIYKLENRCRDTNRGQRALEVCSILAEKCGSLMSRRPSNVTVQIRKVISGGSKVRTRGSTFPLPDSEIHYDAKWLKPPACVFPDVWFQIHRKFSQPASAISRFKLMMWLSTIVFAKESVNEVNQAVLGFATMPAMASIEIPTSDFFDGSQGEEPLRKNTRRLFEDSRLNARSGRRRIPTPKEEKKTAEEEFYNDALSQWRVKRIERRRDASYARLIDVGKAEQGLREMFDSCRKNVALKEYLDKIATVLRSAPHHTTTLKSHLDRKTPHTPRPTPRYVTLSMALEYALNLEAPSPEPAMIGPNLVKEAPKAISSRLSDLLDKVDLRASTAQEHRYAASLRESVVSLEERMTTFELVKTEATIAEHLKTHLNDTRNRFEGFLEKFSQAVGRTSQHSAHRVSSSLAIVATTHHWPRFTISIILEQLNQSNRANLPEQWKRDITLLGDLLTRVQQAERLVQLASSETDLVSELRNQNRDWDPLEYPDYLLLEIEGNLRIRSVQRAIAQEIIAPPDGRNAVFQLIMGEGKSSVLIPMIAAAVADGSRLTRVFVTRSQSHQMNRILISRLGGLLGRKVWRLPITRATKINPNEASTIMKIYRECSRDGGILLVEPEHVLSLKLATLEQAAANPRENASHGLLQVLDYAVKNSRDIVDESDELFNPKLDVVYTFGKQGPIESAPDRWLLAQEVLSLAAKFSTQVKSEYPLSIELIEVQGRFPRIRLFSDEATERLTHLIAAHICRHGLIGLPVGNSSHRARDSILRYITLSEVDNEVVENVETSSLWSPSTMHMLLLLRGLLMKRNGVLAYALKEKRWTTDFGLDRDRKPQTRLAVPYRAKDLPSSRSEYSHQDLQIVLTCLSYYYEGLSATELRQSLQHVSQCDQASNEFHMWVPRNTQIRPEYRNIKGVNVEDETCIQEILPFLRYSKGAIDYFLSRIVFPVEMKQFPERLSGSSWDIGRLKALPVTAFSGTSDRQHLLPLEMEQAKLASQVGTDAMVLSKLLSEENRIVLLSTLGYTSIGSGYHLLQAILRIDPQPRVIIDVGAQILELSNQDAARAWLNLTEDREDIEAALFFTQAGELVVLDQRGHIEPLHTSFYAEQLDLCVVFLDQANTVGSNIAIPRNYRAAVTLGDKLTKDKLAQACLRMRRLGDGQTVVFCVSQEIETRIKAANPRLGANPIEISDIIDWTISETWRDTRQAMGTWAAQGRRFEKERNLWQLIQDSQQDSQSSARQLRSRRENALTISQDLAKKFLESETQTLEGRFRPNFVPRPSIADLPIDQDNLNRIVQRCREFNSSDAQPICFEQQQEKEQEMAPEIEQECQIYRRHDAEPANHRAAEKVKAFIKSGKIGNGSGFLWAFETLQKTSAASHFNLEKFPHVLRATLDFANTIKGDSSREYGTDAYIREVQWVLTSWNANKRETIAVLLSPYEAEQYLPLIEASTHVVLRLFSARKMLSYPALDELNLFTVGKGTSDHPISRNIKIQLNLFAGSLYFTSYSEYVDCADYLCLTWGARAEAADAGVDGYLQPNVRRRQHFGRANFEESPVQFLKVLYSIRHHGMNISKTHIGKMLNGIILTEEDFDPRNKRVAEEELSREEAEESVFVEEDTVMEGAG
ncbi:hypothetical protein HIM_10444 [Hirsutella minnesotensis 3608]|uniref:ubiquitinyl hydrolase 1 n=1 Tax=Hirsutella minnesotensis 3608 TaxID=1043627 RepID=A0A0F7ZK33_9HYPO|nr:hypothetical protein HIM_10444 [Hirsutella minnesotensis 3608]